ncbi:helix-turn-helix domain-containing protein [Saccharibacillus brassicae]|uniref:Helix-turn-helix transcriptional regulator n=1 Tax=Saccharibacillus brassicae TaxID=2583377 RepID=A0A4Y6V3V5_SACBS|nr:AraC family transcriptional regulator [Saccharibacillus brassicae]QDH23246.1 helix-turn-helix transcriptional regulator [Saccharibacillus brassicae]
METAVLNFMSPPIPYFVGCGNQPYAAGERHIHRHAIGIFDIIVVATGSLHIGEEENRWRLGEHEGIILRPDLYHYGVEGCETPTEIMWIHFNTVGIWAEHQSMGEYLLRQQDMKSKHSIHGIYASYINPISLPKRFRLSDKGLSLMRELLRLQDEPRAIAAWAQQTVFQQLLQAMDCEQSLEQDLTSIRVAEKVQRFLHERFNQPINNGLLQETFNFHPNYIARCMRKQFGVTPLEYLMEHRLNIAKKMLLNTGYSIEKIAEEVGMELSTFSNAFRKRESVSPLNYRKKYAKHV